MPDFKSAVSTYAQLSVKAAALAIFVGLTATAIAAPNPLKSFRWEHRIIVVDGRGDSSFVQQLNAVQDELNKRQLLWFVFQENRVTTNFDEALPEGFVSAVRNVYLEKRDEQVVLIGKDGGVKLRANSLDVFALFGLVDSMPMRKQEMRETFEE